MRRPTMKRLENLIDDMTAWMVDDLLRHERDPGHSLHFGLALGRHTTLVNLAQEMDVVLPAFDDIQAWVRDAYEQGARPAVLP